MGLLNGRLGAGTRCWKSFPPSALSRPLLAATNSDRSPSHEDLHADRYPSGAYIPLLATHFGLSSAPLRPYSHLSDRCWTPASSSPFGLDLHPHYGRCGGATRSHHERYLPYEWLTQWQWRSSRPHLRARHLVQPLSLSFIPSLSPSSNIRYSSRRAGIHLR